jgi:hypothetical protein
MSKRMEESEVWSGGIGDVSGIVVGQIWLLVSSGQGTRIKISFQVQKVPIR